MLPPTTDDNAATAGEADSGKKKSRLTRSRARPAKATALKAAEPMAGRARKGARPAKQEASGPVEQPVEARPQPLAEPREAGAVERRETGAEGSAGEGAREGGTPAGTETSESVVGRDWAGTPETPNRGPAAPVADQEKAVPPARSDAAPAEAGPDGAGERAFGGAPGGPDAPPPAGGYPDRGDRGFWKHGKRKRGRHGHWQQGGGGGREQFPPQMPPPSSTPVFGDLPNPTRFNDLAALDALAETLAGGDGEPIRLNELYALSLADLTAHAKRLGLAVDAAASKRQLLVDIFKFAAARQRPLRDTGHIDQNDRGCFVVHEHVNYRLYPEDAYLPDSLVRRYGLKRGHCVEVVLQPPLEGERCPSVVRIDSVMGLPPGQIAQVTPFEELVPYYPLQRILLEDPAVVKDVSMRAVDILTPIGFGQRGLIVAPPRTGKTILLQNIANSVSANSPDVKLILLLIDERPEEVTDFRRHTKGEVVSSTFDETPENHVHCAEMVIEICRRRVERGEHVVILLDSITRLARAYNALTGNQGKTMSGGLESNALQKPKRFFGSARNIEGGGSLTIIASALIDTGSRMDEIIFEEFKGTGNSELHLDRGLVERRIFPAINIDRSGTRKEELIYHPDELQRIYGLRRAMQGLGPIESMEMLITRLKKTKSNAEFLLSLSPK